jgi:hypothetical protein
MNLRRIDTDGERPLNSQTKSGVEAIAEAFLRSFIQSEISKQIVPEIDQDDSQSPLASSYWIGPSDGGKQLAEEEESWGRRDTHEHELRDKTLKRSWLVRPFDRNQANQASINIASSTAVSEEFKNLVLEILKAMPDKLTAALKGNHTEFLVVGDLAEVDEDLALRPARRHPDQELIGNLSAYYEARLNALVFAENPGMIGHSLSSSIAHEFGRALDRALDNFSLSYEFDQAFYADMSKLSPAEKSLLWCFTTPCSEIIQSKDSFEAAKEELFAELFAISQGMGCASKEIDDLLTSKFPMVSIAIATKIAALADRKASP